MDAAKRNSWRTGGYKEFLELSEEEAAYVELRLRLAASLDAKRKSRRMNQSQLAKKMGSSQSRVAKMEGADESVSLDLLIRAHLALGTSPREIGRIIAR